MNEDEFANIYKVSFKIGFNSDIGEKKLIKHLERVTNFLNGHTPFKWSLDWINLTKIKGD